MAQIWEYIKIALMNIRSSKGRSILTMLGIIIGISSVIMVISIGNGVREDQYDNSVDIDYGYHVFPQKEYKGVVYEEGEYESLVVTLGEGSGKNFWCVLFPPLCLLEAEEEETDKVEYKSLIKEVLDKYF